jgi:putative ABC transport system permease protein
MQRARVLDELRQDFVYALRTMRRTAGVSFVIVMTLALGIGANTAVFTLVNAVLLRMLPVHEPERLVTIGNPRRVYSLSDGDPRTDLLSYPLYRDIRMSATTLSGIAATGRAGRMMIRLERAATPERVNGRYVSGNYFRVLGVPAFIGRTFDGSEDATIGGSPIVVVSHGYWMTKLGADPNAVGRTMLIEGVQLPSSA